MNRVKIVATIGPASAHAGKLRELKDAGMAIARLNGSHATLDWHAETIRLIRETLPDVPILLDIPGRKIRTAQLSFEPSFQAGDIIILTTEPNHTGNPKISIGSQTLHRHVSVGDRIVADDGTLHFDVAALDGPDIHCHALVPGKLKSRKGINVPGVDLGAALVTDRDREMMAFAREKGVDFVGISFVESAAHVAAIRELTGGTWPRIISKIENRGGIDNMEAVVAVTDGVMIDRGDLSVETEYQMLAIYQKQILDCARAHGKPVIVATEMLHSMIENPFPTKAEVSDISNAVLDGCAATMLSGETAVGNYVVDAVRVMATVSKTVDAFWQDKHNSAPDRAGVVSVPQAMEGAVELICRELPISKIVAITLGGYAARMVSARRPRQQIIAVSNDPVAARSFNLLAGTTGVYMDVNINRTSSEHIPIVLENLWRQGLLVDEDLVLVTGLTYPSPGDRMNLIETHYVKNLRDVFDWR